MGVTKLTAVIEEVDVRHTSCQSSSYEELRAGYAAAATCQLLRQSLLVLGTITESLCLSSVRTGLLMADAAGLIMCCDGAITLYLLQTNTSQRTKNVTEGRLAQPIRPCCMQTSASKGSNCRHARQARAVCERAYFLGSQRLGSATNRVRSYCIRMSLISLLLCSSTSAMQYRALSRPQRWHAGTLEL